MAVFIRKMELVDEYDNILLKMNHAPAESGLKSALKTVRYMEGDSIIRRIFNFLDEDSKKLFRLEGKNGKNN